MRGFNIIQLLNYAAIEVLNEMKFVNDAVKEFGTGMRLEMDV